MKKTLSILLLLIMLIPALFASVGCDLNDPDRDVKRLFPGSSGYKTTYRSIKREGGKPLLAKIEKELGDSFRGLYETIDIPYTLYEVFSGKTSIGYIHGVNQKGYYGGIQIFLVLDSNANIKNIYFQKHSNRNSKEYRSPAFTKQFIGLSIKDFALYDVKTGLGGTKAAAIKSPVNGDPDFRFIMRGVKKNLVLMEHFRKQ